MRSYTVNSEIVQVIYRPFDAKNPYLAKVVINDELHKSGDRSCRHIEFDISEAKMRYEPGDHLGNKLKSCQSYSTKKHLIFFSAVYPTNDPELVSRLGDILNVDLDTVFSLINVDEDSSKKHPFPCPCTYRTALLHYVDICTPPKTNVLKEIAEHCTKPEEKEFLKSMASAGDESRVNIIVARFI